MPSAGFPLVLETKGLAGKGPKGPWAANVAKARLLALTRQSYAIAQQGESEK